MNSRFTKSVVLAAAAMATLVSAGAYAQDAPPPAPAPANKPKPAPTDYASRWDIFLGYSYLAPKATVNVLQTDGVTVVPRTYDSIDEGVAASGAYYFNKWVGAQVELGVHPDGKNDGISTLQGGMIFRAPLGDITPFAHALAGAARVGGPQHEPYTYGPALTVGGGMDYETPLFNHRLAVRLFQADYEYMHEDFGPVIFGGRANINAARLSGGLVLHVGSIAPPPPVTLACSAAPTSVYPGEPVTITGTADMLNPKKKPSYTWTGSGVTGSDATAKVDTAALAPGSYTVKGNVTQGPKPWESADCSATFTVKQFEPPTVSCSANPSTIKPGDTSTITATGVSPQNRPLTYSYSASAGSVSGTGNSGTYSSAGAPAGTATVTCTVTDDKGQTASATTPVTIEAPPPPPAPQVSSLCSITFDKDKKRPTRVDNEAKACLDDIAATLQSKSDASLAVVGSATPEEKMPPKHMKKGATPPDFAAQRAVNTKDYLVTEKGIDASRITVYTGTGSDKKVEDYLVPSGATFSNGTAVSGDVKAQPRKAAPAKHHKKAAK